MMIMMIMIVIMSILPILLTNIITFAISTDLSSN